MTTSQTSKRRQALESFVSQNPEDAFSRYGLALECANIGDHEAAMRHFQELLNRHPSYVAGHFQYGQLLARMGQAIQARAVLTSGIEAARRAGNSHAAEEMQATLESLQ